MFSSRRPSLHRPAGSAGFSLVELLVAVAILSILIVALVGFAEQASNAWIKGENQNAYRLRTRAVLDYMGNDLRHATLAVNQAVAVAQGRPTLQFLVNPSSVTLNYPHSIFWQAPIATDNQGRGDIAEVGYFIRWSNGEADLCRFLVNPGDPANYRIYTAAAGQWISDAILSAAAPSDSAHNYTGLFLENVLGLWVQAYDIGGHLLALPYDSSQPAAAAHPLPAYLVISMATLDASGASRLKSAPSGAGAVQALVAASVNAQAFTERVNTGAKGPVPEIANKVNAVSLMVSLDNYR